MKQIKRTAGKGCVSKRVIVWTTGVQSLSGPSKESCKMGLRTVPLKDERLGHFSTDFLQKKAAMIKHWYFNFY